MEIDKILNLPRADQRITSPKTPPNDQISVTIDAESFAEFTVSRQLLTSNSTYLSRLFGTRPSSNGNTALPDDHIRGIISKTGTSQEKLYLTILKVCDFLDFIRWPTTGHILPFHHGYDQITMRAFASRVIRALDIGIMLESNKYIMAAMKKFHEIGAYLERPEDFVNEIFTATRHSAIIHPARRMIVAIVAAKTTIKGKKALVEHGTSTIERGERLKTATFWDLYDEYYDVKRGEFAYPQTSAESMCWGSYKTR